MSLDDPDALAFLEANPYNLRHLASSLYGVADTAYYGKDMTDEQIDSLIYAGFWHAPPWGVHMAHKLGAFSTHTGGFGYYRSLSMFPALGAYLAYFTVGREVVAAPNYSIRYTAGDDMRVHIGGGYSFRNPISGM